MTYMSDYPIYIQLCRVLIDLSLHTSEGQCLMVVAT